MNAIKAVFIREARAIFGRRSYIFLFLVWPLLYGLLLGGIYSEKIVVKMPIAVADNDNSSMSRLVIRYLDACRSLDVAYRVQSKEELQELLYREKVVAAVYLPRGLERTVKHGESEVVTAFVSGTNYMMASLALSDLKTAMGTVNAGIRINYLRKTGSSRDKAMALQSQVNTDLTKLFNPGYNYLNYLPPGMWMTILQQFIILFGALMIAGEVDKGTLSSLLAAARGRATAIVAGKYAFYTLIGTALLFIFYAFFFPLFGIPGKADYLVLAPFTLLFILASLSFGFLLSAAMRKRSDAIKGALLVSAPAFLLSGYTWPIELMPFGIKLVAWTIPLTFYLQGFRKVFQQGVGLSYIGFESLILAAMTVAFTATGLFFLKRIIKEDAHVH